MATEPIREVLGRPLPELPLGEDGTPVDTADVAVWCQAAVELINDLRAHVVELAEQTEGGANAFNRMVRLGNQAADNIVMIAHEEANRILASAQAQAGTAEATPASSDPVDAADASFREEWERDASIDERVADRAFFSEGFEEPSRSWILADTA